MTEDNRRINAEAEARKGALSLSAADQLLALGLYDDAMSRLYYAAYHLATAALLLLGVEATSHRGLLGLFSLHLVKPGLVGTAAARLLTNLMSLRHQADYNRHFVFDEVGARAERDRAQPLLDELGAFLSTRGIAPGAGSGGP